MLFILNVMKMAYQKVDLMCKCIHTSQKTETSVHYWFFDYKSFRS